MADGSSGRERRPVRLLPSLPLLVAPLLLIGLQSCLRVPEAALLRRYLDYEVGDTTGLVDIAVFSTPVPAEAPVLRLLELSKSAQSELIESLADKTTTLEQFLEAMSTPIGSVGGWLRVEDRTRFRRRLIVSVEERTSGTAGGALSPGARISRLRITLALDSAVARFAEWNRFVTRYETIDLGRMELRRSSELGLDLELRPEGGPGGLNRLRWAAGSESALEEQVSLRQRYVSTGMLRPDSMILLQRGAVGLDLTGNKVLEVEIDVADAPSTTLYAVRDLFDPDGLARSPDSVRIVSSRVLRAPKLSGGVRAELRFEAVVRTIVPGHGDGTFTEGDDRVRFLRTLGGGRRIVLVPEDELRASAWEIVDSTCTRILHLWNGGTRRPEVLHLATAEDADRFLRWLLASRSTRPDGRQLFLGPDRPLTRQAMDSLAVRLLPLNWELGEGARCP